MVLQCDICCDKFTTKLRHPIKCDYEDCKGKPSVFNASDASSLWTDQSRECMACKQAISTEFIFMHTPKVFRDEYVKKVVELDLVKETRAAEGDSRAH